jgi:hypothetical protein
MVGSAPYHADAEGELLTSPHHQISPQIGHNPTPHNHADAKLAPIKITIHAQTAGKSPSDWFVGDSAKYQSSTFQRLWENHEA